MDVDTTVFGGTRLLTAFVDRRLAPHRGEDRFRPRLGGCRQAQNFALKKNGPRQLSLSDSLGVCCSFFFPFPVVILGACTFEVRRVVCTSLSSVHLFVAHTDTQSDTQTHTGTEADRHTQTHTDTHRHRQTQTDADRRRQTHTQTQKERQTEDRQRQTETDRQRQADQRTDRPAGFEGGTSTSDGLAARGRRFWMVKNCFIRVSC